ncbi:MAG: ATP-binding cassette domain-containing protein [Candidatus Berkiellales bacterium]
MNEPVIQIQDLTKVFTPGTPPALDQLSLNLRVGGITGLVGPDGAGKTTFIRLLTGLMQPTTGVITVNGFDTRKDIANIFNILGYMPQKFGLYEDLTVIENLNLYAKLRGITGQAKTSIFERMLSFTDLKPFTSRLAGKLSGGMKQKLGLACALLGRPQILLLDEPSVGVDPVSRRELWKMVQDLTKEGILVLWSTSYLDEAERCQEVLLINEGKLLFKGPPSHLTKTVNDRVFLATPPATERRKLLSKILNQPGILDGVIQGKNLRIVTQNETRPLLDLTLIPTTPRFEDAFIDILKGKFSRTSTLAAQLQPKSEEIAEPIRGVGLTKIFGEFTAANNISFSVKRGEIFGLLGPNGAGKSTVFKMMCGLLQPTHGQAFIAGFDLKSHTSQAQSRIGYMAQKFSLYGDLSVTQNLDFFSGVYGLAGKKQKLKKEQMIEIFDLKKYLNMNAGTLPLGYKQRLALSCAVMHDPDVLFLDEPTSGVDPLTRREFWTHINGMVQKGVTIMITTHFMDEAEYCDRIALIYRGVNIATDTPDALKDQVHSTQLPSPTLEDAFIELIQRQAVEKNG